MYIDWMTFSLSAMAGLAVGFFVGSFGITYAADAMAKRSFDALLVLRGQAKMQMDEYDDSQKPKETQP